MDNPIAATSPRNVYGHRARVGYTSPPAATEVFPYEFYLVAPKGVTLVISTLAIVEMSSEEIDRSYEISLQAARELSRSHVDLVVLGGLPINRSRGSDVDALIREVESAIDVPVTTSTTAQMSALKMLGARRVAIGHPFAVDQDPVFARCLDDYGFSVSSIKGAGYPANELGLIPRNTALALGRALLEQDPKADTIWLPCPHWAVAESIEPLEQMLGVNVVSAHQAITWHALRRCNVADAILGYGRLLREF